MAEKRWGRHLKSISKHLTTKTFPPDNCRIYKGWDTFDALFKGD